MKNCFCLQRIKKKFLFLMCLRCSRVSSPKYHTIIIDFHSSVLTFIVSAFGKQARADFTEWAGYCSFFVWQDAGLLLNVWPQVYETVCSATRTPPTGVSGSEMQLFWGSYSHFQLKSYFGIKLLTLQPHKQICFCPDLLNLIHFLNMM